MVPNDVALVASSKWLSAQYTPPTDTYHGGLGHPLGRFVHGGYGSVLGMTALVASVGRASDCYDVTGCGLNSVSL